MQKQELQKLLSSKDLNNQADLRIELESLLSSNKYNQDYDNISLEKSLSLSTYKYLLDNGFNSNQFLAKAMDIYCYNKTDENKKLSLVKLALNYKADPNTLWYSSQDSEKYLDLLLENGLTLNNALKLILNKSVDSYDSNTKQYLPDQEKINLRDKLAIDLINKGANFNDLNGIYHECRLSFLSAQKEFLLNHPSNHLTADNYLKIAFDTDTPTETHKNMLEEALARGANPKLINQQNFYINIERFLNFKDVLFKHLNLDYLLELTISTYSSDSEKAELKYQIMLELIDKGANINNIFGNNTYYSKNVFHFVNSNAEYLLNHQVHPLTPNNYLHAALRMSVKNGTTFEQDKLELQYKALDKALSRGADIHKALEKNHCNNLKLEQLEFHKDLIVKHVGASFLLLWTVIINSNFNQPEYYGIIKSEAEIIANSEKAIELIKFAIDNGADVNFNYSGQTALEITKNQEIIALLKSYGAETANTELEEFYQNGLYQLLWQPKIVFEKKYHNLDAQASIEAKMPYLMHHIWLTHPNSPQEIRSHDLENAIKTKEIFAKSDVTWTHIVWTNDKSLIQESAEKLAAHGIETRSIYDYQDTIASLDIITNSIDQKKWGMASDTLRYSLVEEFGGVYADINFIFNRDVTSEAHKYNFFTSTYGEYYIDNFFFGASPHHPVVQKMVELTERNLVNPPKYLADIQNQDSRVITDMGTANPTFIAYYLEANKYGNIDVVYPSTNTDSMREEDLESYISRYLETQQHKGIEDSSYNDFMLYIHQHEICGIDTLYIGHDSTDGQTWVN